MQRWRGDADLECVDSFLGMKGATCARNIAKSVRKLAYHTGTLGVVYVASFWDAYLLYRCACTRVMLPIMQAHMFVHMSMRLSMPVYEYIRVCVCIHMHIYMPVYVCCNKRMY